MRQVIIVGASARAAAFSAMRAGLQPYCIDLFADRDLASRCTVRAVSPAGYPRNIGQCFKDAPDAPWLYVGGIENYPELIADWSRQRELLGNDAATIRAVRDPLLLYFLFRDVEHVAIPPACDVTERRVQRGRWLLKPFRGAGGSGIIDSTTSIARYNRSHYAQRYVEGESHSALYVMNAAEGARLLGVTRQIVGEAWLRAAPFQYCGSVGPASISAKTIRRLDLIGRLLANAFRFQGLVGVDFILRDETPWMIEVNPRYVASTEVLEYATGTRAMAEHRRCFEVSPPASPAPSGSADFVGKVILFARERLTFPEDGPWMESIERSDVHEMPAFADVPRTGTTIEKGRPILTLFARWSTFERCREALRQKAAMVEDLLYPP